MAYMQWEKKYSVGISKIDEQHMKLFSYINDLHDAMKNGKSKDILAGLINQLVNYTLTHFSLEEEYMSKYKYIDYLQHQKEHKAFVEKITAFRNDYNLTSGVVSIELMNFLKDWLVKHVLGTDKKYVPFLMGKGVK